MDALGQRLVVWRDASGAVHAHDRFCPHMGASLANGEVRGERLVCPFHHWEYGADGACAHIPYAARIPPGARVERFTVCEHVGLVWLWHGSGAPTYTLPEVPEYGATGFALRSRVQHFDMHPLLLLENGCDAQHFKYVHGVDFQRYEVEMTREEPHAFGFRVHQQMAGPLGTSFEIVTGIEYAGASAIFGTLEREGELTARFIAAPTPVAPGRIRFALSVVAKRLPWFLRPLDPLYLRFFAKQIFDGSTDDYGPIWSAMDPSRRGVLVAEDKLQQRFRAYYREHLPEGQRPARL